MAIAMTTQRVEVGTDKSTPVERYTLQPDLGQPAADHGDFSPHLQSRPCEEHRRAQPGQPGTERLGKRVSFVAVEGWKVLKEGWGKFEMHGHMSKKTTSCYPETSREHAWKYK